MLLIISDSNDVHADHVELLINNKSIPYFRLNLDVQSLRSTEMTFEADIWYIINDNGQFKSNEIRCVWMRRASVEVLLDEMDNQSIDFKIWRSEWNKSLAGLFHVLRNTIWLNSYRKAFRAENKYLQMDVARKVGLRFPPTIISNNKNKLLQFASKYESIVLKMMAQEIYKSDSGLWQGIYVNKLSLTELDRFGSLQENPTVLQAYIEKDYEVRYTVVADQHFVCKIESQKSRIASIDWRRYDLPNTPHSPIEPPDNIRQKVGKLLEELGLNYGALDFIVTKSGEWIFLEINPMGQFLWIEDLTGLRISESIVNWIQNVLSTSQHV